MLQLDAVKGIRDSRVSDNVIGAIRGLLLIIQIDSIYVRNKKRKYMITRRNRPL